MLYSNPRIRSATESFPASNASYWERTDRNVAANGAVMRTAIIGCLLFPDADGVSGIERSMSSAIQIAATTHADPRCLISCAIVSGAVAAVRLPRFF